jgi:hypothetical protein
MNNIELPARPTLFNTACPEIDSSRIYTFTIVAENSLVAELQEKLSRHSGNTNATIEAIDNASIVRISTLGNTIQQICTQMPYGLIVSIEQDSIYAPSMIQKVTGSQVAIATQS